MRNIIFILLCLLMVKTSVAQNLYSPDGNLTLTFLLNDIGTPSYKLLFKGKTVIDESKMGFTFNTLASFTEKFVITDTKFSTSDKV